MASFSVDTEIIQELHREFVIPKFSKKKCPMNVDKFTMVNNIRSEQNTNHFWSIQHTVLRGNEHIKEDNSQYKKTDLGSSVAENKYELEKIEESYWSKWKPNKKSILLEEVEFLKKKSADNVHKKIINTEKENVKVFNVKEVQSYCTAIDSLKTTEITEVSLKEINSSLTKQNTEVISHSNMSNESENLKKTQFQKHIHLRSFKNPSSYIKGGSYPLRSPKKEVSINIKGKLNKSQNNNSLRSNKHKMTISRFFI